MSGVCPVLQAAVVLHCTYFKGVDTPPIIVSLLLKFSDRRLGAGHLYMKSIVDWRTNKTVPEDFSVQCSLIHGKALLLKVPRLRPFVLVVNAVLR